VLFRCAGVGVEVLLRDGFLERADAVIEILVSGNGQLSIQKCAHGVIMRLVIRGHLSNFSNNASCSEIPGVDRKKFSEAVVHPSSGAQILVKLTNAIPETLVFAFGAKCGGERPPILDFLEIAVQSIQRANLFLAKLKGGEAGLRRRIQMEAHYESSQTLPIAARRAQLVERFPRTSGVEHIGEMELSAIGSVALHEFGGDEARRLRARTSAASCVMLLSIWQSKLRSPGSRPGLSIYGGANTPASFRPLQPAESATGLAPGHNLLI
jgi:hypothetical protein